MVPGFESEEPSGLELDDLVSKMVHLGILDEMAGQAGPSESAEVIVST